MRQSNTKVLRTCLLCGKEFEAHRCRVEHGGAKFCSTSCGTTYRNIHNNPTKDPAVREKISLHHSDVRGSNNPMYGVRGKDAPSYIDGRNSFVGETYRKKLLASGRTKTCEVCGTTENLHVHHKDGNHKNDELDNLMWVCVTCHNNVAHNYKRDTLGRFIGSDLAAI